MKIVHVNNDILEEPTNIICHQVNCMGVMGAGLAKQIKEKYPFVYSEYKDLCDLYKEKSDVLFLLGKAQIFEVKNKSSMSSTYNDFKYDDSFFICNLFGQYNYGKTGTYTRKSSLRQAIMYMFFLISSYSSLTPYRVTISIPYGMGCGLGGGNWEEIEPLIIDTFKEAEEKYTIDITLKIVKKD